VFVAVVVVVAAVVVVAVVVGPQTLNGILLFCRAPSLVNRISSSIVIFILVI
jgi:hypothetical protein